MQKNEAMMKAKGPILPAIVAWDFAAAFPSQFLWLVLSCMQIPLGLQNLIRGMYWQGSAWSVGGDWLFHIFRGVLQGCPLSGMIDLQLVHGPFLEVDEGRCRRRACRHDPRLR